MQLLAAIIGLMGIALFLWYRSKMAGEGVNQIGPVRGNNRRKTLLGKADTSPITAIDNPLIAAATLMVSIQSEEFVLGDGDEEVIEALLLKLANVDNIKEAMVYAKWAVLQVTDAKVVIDKLGNFLKTQLNDLEKIRFLELLDEANQKIGGCYDFGTSRLRLARKMGLETTH